MRDTAPIPGDPKPGPRHVAIIMDGNGRWATRRGLPRIAGHKEGVERVREIVEASPDLGVEHLTLFAFSTENWKRSTEEVSGLMGLFRRYIRKEAAELERRGAAVRFIGDRSALDQDLQDLMAGLEARTRDNARLRLTVAMNYGGRCEITRAVRRLAERAALGEIAPQDITEQTLAAALDDPGAQDPDLIIRTSGEMRLSNFMIWQAAYAELAFVDDLWPDFTAKAFARVLSEFTTRDRRFGAAVG